jgi:2,4-diaminopentanoate dehydrogenase
MAEKKGVPPYRVVHWGTGNTGTQAVRQLIEHPDMELVGLKVHSPDKEGRDAGELCGIDPVGIAATRDIDRLLALRPDCLVYMATEYGRDQHEVIDDLCHILESGVNVVNTTMPALVHPAAAGMEVAGRLEAAALAGGVTFYATGIEPGFTGDELVLTCTSMSRRIESIEVHERMNVADYADPVSAAAYGFGKTPEMDRETYRPGLMINVWKGVIGALAAGLDVQVDDIREIRDVALAPEDFPTAIGIIRKGAIAGVHFRIEGIVAGKARLAIEHDYVLRDDIGDGWRQPPLGRETCRNTHIRIKGLPDITLDLSLAGQGSIGQGVTATAARAVNAIPVVCAAAPGVRTSLDVLPVIGRHAMRF